MLRLGDGIKERDPALSTAAARKDRPYNRGLEPQIRLASGDIIKH